MANALQWRSVHRRLTVAAKLYRCLSGDGGFAMLMGDFISLVQLGLPVKVVIFDNGTLGFVELEMKASGLLEFGVELKNPDFAAMARTMGVHAARVEDPADLQEALKAAFAHPGPALVDVVTNRAELSLPPKIGLKEAEGFSLWVVKAVLSGAGRRGHRSRPNQHDLRVVQMNTVDQTVGQANVKPLRGWREAREAALASACAARACRKLRR